MGFLVRLKVSDTPPKWQYYAGYRRGGTPPGPIMVTDPEKAHEFPSRGHGDSVIAGDERLRGAEVRDKAFCVAMHLAP